MGFDISNVTDQPCGLNCSGHGQCYQGACVCMIEFSGSHCERNDSLYFFMFGAAFSLVCFVTTLQLCMCIVCEYRRSGNKSWRSACGITVQKLLYLVVICATALRGTFFLSKLKLSEYVSSCLWCAYFPFLITGFSLIIFSWAEDVHVVRTQTPRFLSKSVLAFILFNVALYLMVCAVLVITDIVPNTEELSLKAYNGSVAVLLIILVVVFLVYGVELYFKIHRAFPNLTPGVEVDRLQVAMSRLGLLSQAALQFLVGLFLVGDVVTDHWKNVMTVLGQNYYEVVFHVIEFGAVLWFPCVLWNCKSPETLWVLNPRRVLRSLQFSSPDIDETSPLQPHAECSRSDYNTFQKQVSVASSTYDCWICYDPDRTDAGPLIQPCLCKGDTGTVHHNCLQRWLVESSEQGQIPSCKVCKQKYKLQRKSTWIPRGLGSRHLAVLIVLLVTMLGSPVLSYFICHLDVKLYYKILVTGSTILFEIVGLRLLSKNLLTISKRVELSSTNIIGKEITLKKRHNQDTDVNVVPRQSIKISPSSELSSSTRTIVEIHCYE